MRAIPLDESHLNLVRRVARHVGRRLPRHVSIDDLVGAGSVGLVDASRKFDPSKGVAFDAYAAIRIRGAILDELRVADSVPRSSRGGRSNEGDDRSTSGVGDSVGRPARPSFVPYDSVSEDAEEQGCDTRQADSMVEREEVRRALRTAVAGLERKLQIVLSLYYAEGLTLREIGGVLEVTESRACQLHSLAMDKLRKSLGSSLE